VSWGVNRVDLFAKAAESGDCLHLFWDDTLGGWGPKRDGAAHWESLGGPLKTDPTGLTWEIKDRVDVLAVFEDGGLSHRIWEKGWQPWERLGDQLLSSRPSVVSWGDQRIDVVAHSAGDDILHIRFDPKLGGWRGPDGKFAGSDWVPPARESSSRAHRLPSVGDQIAWTSSPKEATTTCTGRLGVPAGRPGARLRVMSAAISLQSHREGRHSWCSPTGATSGEARSTRDSASEGSSLCSSTSRS
jgi:hypothetical protein